jgi:hypothetical protein
VPSSPAETGMRTLRRCSASNSAVKVLPTHGGPLIQSVSRITMKTGDQTPLLQEDVEPLPFSFYDIVRKAWSEQSHVIKWERGSLSIWGGLPSQQNESRILNYLTF